MSCRSGSKCHNRAVFSGKHVPLFVTSGCQYDGRRADRCVLSINVCTLLPVHRKQKAQSTIRRTSFLGNHSIFPIMCPPFLTLDSRSNPSLPSSPCFAAEAPDEQAAGVICLASHELVRRIVRHGRSTSTTRKRRLPVLHAHSCRRRGGCTRDPEHGLRAKKCLCPKLILCPSPDLNL